MNKTRDIDEGTVIQRGFILYTNYIICHHNFIIRDGKVNFKRRFPVETNPGGTDVLYRQCSWLTWRNCIGIILVIIILYVYNKSHTCVAKGIAPSQVHSQDFNPTWDELSAMDH